MAFKNSTKKNRREVADFETKTFQKLKAFLQKYLRFHISLKTKPYGREMTISRVHTMGNKQSGSKSTNAHFHQGQRIRKNYCVKTTICFAVSGNGDPKKPAALRNSSFFVAKPTPRRDTGKNSLYS